MEYRNDNYQPIGHFRFWCQKVLPAVYDDSLSYYELLCKVVKYLNDVIETVNLHSQAITELQETLQQFIDGDFDEMIEAKVEEWFEENEPEIIQAIEELNDAIDDVNDRIDDTNDRIDNLDFTNVYITDGMVTGNPNTEVSIRVFDGIPQLRIRVNISENSLNDTTDIEGKTLKYIFEDSNIISLTDNNLSWNTGSAVFDNASIQVQDNIPMLVFNSSNDGSNSTATLPNRTFESGHTYVLLGQYRHTIYTQGNSGIRTVNRFIFEPFMSDNFINFLHVITKPPTESEEPDYISGDSVSQKMIIGNFYDEKSTVHPYISTRVRLLVLLDLTTTFDAVPTMDSLKKAFDKYCSVKNNKQYQTYYIPMWHYQGFTTTDRTNFIKMMRYRGYSIGMRNSHWYTPNGFPQSGGIQQAQGVNYGNVKDALRLAIAAFSNNMIQTIVSSMNKAISIYGNRSLTEAEFRNYTESDYPYSVLVNNSLENLHDSSIAMPYDILAYKGGSLGAAGNLMPWSYEPNNVGIFRSYVGVTEFKDNRAMIYAILGGDGSWAHEYMVYAIQQYMISMDLNDGVPLTQEQEETLANNNASYAILKQKENGTQKLSWAAIVLPPMSTLYTSMPDNQLYTDHTGTKPIHLYHFVNESLLYPYASVSKLLTCLITVESGIDLVKPHIVLDMDLVNGSGTILRQGMKINCRDLMYNALFNSDNDACNVLARVVGNSIKGEYFDSCYVCTN